MSSSVQDVGLVESRNTRWSLQENGTLQIHDNVWTEAPFYRYKAALGSSQDMSFRAIDI